MGAALGLVRAGYVLAPFNSTLSLQGVTFVVQCPNGPEGNTVTITPTGLLGDNTPMSDHIEGTVMGAEIADLNADGSPEVYVYIRTGPDSRGSVIAYGANQKKSLSRIFVPDLSGDPKAAAGYTGSDGFAVVENKFVRRFPVGGGKIRQIQYKLVPGEAGWKLQQEKVTEY